MATSPIYNWPEPDNTDLVKNGALAIRTLGNAIDTTMATMVPKTIVDAKGDLIAGTAADTTSRLAVGNNGETLVADSSTSTGLRYQSNFAAGKNKIINGDFGIWQRGTSFTTNGVYYADRFYGIWDGTGTKTISQQTFTPATAPVSGYEGQYFLRFNQTVAGTSGTYNVLSQKIEDVRTFAGQTATLSFWAKAGSSISMNAAPNLNQGFGSGGSGTVVNAPISGSAPALTTSWQRFSFTYNVASISGKTIGTGSSLNLEFYMPINTTFAIDIWGVQVEAGSVATAFQTATGTIQGELAACQRYYYRVAYGNGSGNYFGTGIGISTTRSFLTLALPVSMRTQPSFAYGGTPAISDTNTSNSVTNLVFYAATTGNQQITLDGYVSSGLTQFRPYFLLLGGTGQLIELSAEL